MWVQSLGQEDPLEEGMAIHSSVLAWKNPWTEEPGSLLSLGSQRASHDGSNRACMHTHVQLEQYAAGVKVCVSEPSWLQKGAQLGSHLQPSSVVSWGLTQGDQGDRDTTKTLLIAGGKPGGKTGTTIK